MSTRPCTCGALDAEAVDESIIGLPEHAIVDRLAQSLGMDPRDVRRVIFGVAHALPLPEAETLIAYQQREAIGAEKRRVERQERRDAAIAAAGRRTG